jgi:hypothetical protein
MSIRKIIKNLRNWCPQPSSRLPTKLKNYSAPVAIVLVVTIFSISFFVVSSNLLFESSAVKTLPILPVSASTSDLSGFGEVISQDTTWTKANSPYDLSGNVLVSKGVTLTIEAGVTVNFYRYIMQVNGTLRVQGTNINNVVFVNTNRNVTDATKDQIASINFGDESSNDAIEYTVFDAMGITYYNCNSSITLNHDVLKNQAFSTYFGGFFDLLLIIRGPGSATITNNVFTGSLQDQCGSSTIYNNTFTDGGVDLENGSFLISNNTFIGDATADSGFGLTIGYRANAVISDNSFTGYSEACINTVTSSFALIQRNYIQNKLTFDGYPFFGIEISGSSPTIENNTITNCNIGIDVYSHGSDYSAIEAKPTIINNDIYNNQVFNLYLGYPERGGDHTIDYVIGNIEAANNWWGTTDAQAINQTMRDSKVQSNLGTVNFTPFLTAPNLQTTPNSTEPTPTIKQIPSTTFLEATKDSGGKVDIIVNGNLSLGLISLANLTSSQSSATSNLTFTVTGDADTNAFINVTIPKNAVTYGPTPTVYIGNQKVQNQSYTQDVDNYYVWGTNHFNNSFYGDLTIEFTNVTSSSTTFPTIIGAIIAVAVAALTLIAYRRMKRG